MLLRMCVFVRGHLLLDRGYAHSVLSKIHLGNFILKIRPKITNKTNLALLLEIKQRFPLEDLSFFST